VPHPAAQWCAPGFSSRLWHHNRRAAWRCSGDFSTTGMAGTNPIAGQRLGAATYWELSLIPGVPWGDARLARNTKCAPAMGPTELTSCWRKARPPVWCSAEGNIRAPDGPRCWARELGIVRAWSTEGLRDVITCGSKAPGSHVDSDRIKLVYELHNLGSWDAWLHRTSCLLRPWHAEQNPVARRRDLQAQVLACSTYAELPIG